MKSKVPTPSPTFSASTRVSGDLHNIKGFGLGLYYVRLITERHGGEVSVVSSPGRGSIFILTLPDDER
ncbi:hypothetical protein B5G09_13035 [Alistipes sp. An54]|nr:hypothetical protein B5G09_13035 [Alistipes sp. An54]